MTCEWLPGMRNITGAEGECEEACRKLVAAAVRWLEEHPKAELRYGPSGFAESMDARELHAAIFDAAPSFFGVVGGLATQHARFIHAKGWDAYVAAMMEARCTK